MSIELVREFPCDNAESFLKMLTPGTGQLANQTHIYRGQADDKWNLIPASERKLGHITARSLYGTDYPTGPQQRVFEAAVLRKFLDACDISGLVVPGYNKDTQSYLKAQEDIQALDSRWPAPHIHECLAVAQHYGIPTRLLDWTRRSYVAAYFAVSSALRANNSEGNIAVWALDIKHHAKWRSVSMIVLPGGTAPNMAAQSGIFTAVRGTFPVYNAGEGLESVRELSDPMTNGEKPLFKITVPRTECASILRLLELYGVSAPVLFPGMEGAKQYVADWAQSDFFGQDRDYNPPTLFDLSTGSS